MNSDASGSEQTLLEEIDAQQDQLLDQLDALNARIEQVLKAHGNATHCVSSHPPELCRLAD